MKKQRFQTYWKKYEPLIEAVVELFHPFVEAAVHDLEEGKVVAIYHNISQRKVGETSPIYELKINTTDFPDRFAPYYKRNWDGRPLKCTSITVRNEKGKAVGLVCFNMDVSLMQETYHVLETFLKTKEEGENPIEIFGGQYEEQVISIIQQFIETKQLSLNYITRDQKKEIVQLLYDKGVFNFKNAAPFIARYLKISRASIYNYIKKIGDKNL